MPRLTRIYTRTGDDGETGLGSGRRVAKDSTRIEAYGTVDELNSTIGAALSTGCQDDVREVLARIQNELFHLGSALCWPAEERGDTRIPCVEERHVQALEADLDRFAGELRPLENFILPGGTPSASWLHVARCVCRRAERRVVTLARTERVEAAAVPYLNRLSDLLFVLARVENARRGRPDVTWDSRA